MTVAALRDALAGKSDDAQVFIAQYQKYGSDFTYRIEDIQEDMVMLGNWGTDEDGCVFIVLGEQCGTPSEPDDEEIFVPYPWEDDEE